MYEHRCERKNTKTIKIKKSFENITYEHNFPSPAIYFLVIGDFFLYYSNVGSVVEHVYL